MDDPEELLLLALADEIERGRPTAAAGNQCPTPAERGIAVILRIAALSAIPPRAEVERLRDRETELLQANNREVERRRAAETALRNLLRAMAHDLEVARQNLELMALASDEARRILGEAQAVGAAP
jgi:hypothetical protein